MNCSDEHNEGAPNLMPTINCHKLCDRGGGELINAITSYLIFFCVALSFLSFIEVSFECGGASINQE